MALFTDGPIAAIDDIRRYDSAVLDVAIAEGIDLEAKLDISQREIGLEISAFLLRSASSERVRRDLGHVVLTDAVLHAQCLHTIELVYRDAYNSQLNDRYAGKWKEYGQLATHSLRLLFDIGVGVNDDAIPRPGDPSCNWISGGPLIESTYYVAIAYEKSGVTGSLSQAAIVNVPALSLLTVANTSLPVGIDGWHVYAGASSLDLRRQTAVRLPASSTWTQAPQGLRSDLPPIPEQTATAYVTNPHILRRG